MVIVAMVVEVRRHISAVCVAELQEAKAAAEAANPNAKKGNPPGERLQCFLC